MKHNNCIIRKINMPTFFRALTATVIGVCLVFLGEQASTSLAEWSESLCTLMYSCVLDRVVGCRLRGEHSVWVFWDSGGIYIILIKTIVYLPFKEPQTIKIYKETYYVGTFSLKMYLHNSHFTTTPSHVSLLTITYPLCPLGTGCLLVVLHRCQLLVQQIISSMIIQLYVSSIYLTASSSMLYCMSKTFHTSRKNLNVIRDLNAHTKTVLFQNVYKSYNITCGVHSKNWFYSKLLLWFCQNMVHNQHVYCPIDELGLWTWVLIGRQGEQVDPPTWFSLPCGIIYFKNIQFINYLHKIILWTKLWNWYTIFKIKILVLNEKKVTQTHNLLFPLQIKCYIILYTSIFNQCIINKNIWTNLFLFCHSRILLPVKLNCHFHNDAYYSIKHLSGSTTGIL